LRNGTGKGIEKRAIAAQKIPLYLRNLQNNERMKPDKGLLKKYAQVMVHYALNDGKGINKGDTVFLVGQE
jgi:hypothetical protein